MENNFEIVNEKLNYNISELININIDLLKRLNKGLCPTGKVECNGICRTCSMKYYNDLRKEMLEKYCVYDKEEKRLNMLEEEVLRIKQTLNIK